MVIGVLTAEERGLEAASNARLLAEITHRGHTAVPLHLGNWAVVHDGAAFRWRSTLPQPDVVIARPTNAREPSLYVYALERLAALGVPLVNGPQAVLTAKSKLRQYTQLQAAGVRVPRGTCVGSTASARAVAEELEYPVMVKVSFGLHGKGVFFVPDVQTLTQTVDYLTVRDRNPVLIQEYLPEVAAYGDLRVLVVDGQIVGAMVKVPRREERRTNIAQGAQPVAVQLSLGERQDVLRAVSVTGLDVAGVDAVRISAGLVILEINACPGYVGLESVLHASVSSYFVNAAVRRVDCGQAGAEV